MKKFLLLFIVLGLVLVSCGTTRFSFDRTERNIVELGGKYDKKTEEDIKKLYEKDGLDEVIKEVYEGTYTVIDVQGYLGDDIWKEYQKRDEELLKEIEMLRKTEGLDAVVSAVLDETYPENMVVAAFGGEEKRLAADFRANLEEKTNLRDDLRQILEEEGYEGIKNALVEGIYDEETIEEYLGTSTLDAAKEIYAKETGTDGFTPLKKGEGIKNSNNNGEMEFVSSSKTSANNQKSSEEQLIITIVSIVVVLIVIYVLAAVARSLNKGPIKVVIAIPVTFIVTALAVGISTLLTGWTIYYLAYLLVLPAYFILTAEMRD